MSWFAKFRRTNTPEMEPVIPGGGSDADATVASKISNIRRRTSTSSSVSSSASTATDRHRQLDEFFERNDDVDEELVVPDEFVRHQRENSEATLKGLNPGFFRKDFDPVAHLLKNLPDDKSGADLVQLLQLEISKKDIAQDYVKENITDKILEKYDTFLRGMRQIQDVDMDLKIARETVARGKEAVRQSRVRLVDGTLTIPFKRRRQERLKVVGKIVESVRGTHNVEAKVEQCLAQRDYPSAVETLTSTWDVLNSPFALQLRVLDGLRKRFPA
eukprot:g2157.t1